MTIVYPRVNTVPRVLQAKRPGDASSMVVRDLLEMRRAGQREAITSIIRMVKDLKESGRESRYAIPLKGSPLWELKTRSRGGEKGGARVYFFWTLDGAPILCGAEVKDADAPSQHLLKEALGVIVRQKKGERVI